MCERRPCLRDVVTPLLELRRGSSPRRAAAGRSAASSGATRARTRRQLVHDVSVPSSRTPTGWRIAIVPPGPQQRSRLRPADVRIDPVEGRRREDRVVARRRQVDVLEAAELEANELGRRRRAASQARSCSLRARPRRPAGRMRPAPRSASRCRPRPRRRVTRRRARRSRRRRRRSHAGSRSGARRSPRRCCRRRHRISIARTSQPRPYPRLPA